MIEFVSGNMFDFDANIRVNTVNCVGVMGAGVALMFKNRYPNMFADYADACKRKEVKPGNPHVWQHVDLISQCTIINFPTKVHWKNPSEYEYIEKGLLWLRSFLINKDNSIVTLPAVGCGHGGLEWEKVKEMIVKYLGDVEAKIFVFAPSSSTKTFKQVVYNTALQQQGIYKLLPSDKFYPAKLVGRSVLEIYYKGSINLLLRKNLVILENPKSSEREKKALLQIISELPLGDFVFLLGLGNSYEADIAKEILMRGHKAIFTVPYGILQLKIRKDLDLYWDYQKILVLSTTNPGQTWKGYECVSSLHLRLKLADNLLINCLDIENLIQYENDIKKAESNVFYVNYWNNGVDIFNRLTAHKIGINPNTGKPNIFPLLYSI